MKSGKTNGNFLVKALCKLLILFQSRLEAVLAV
jgi:hypothetical protein